MGILHFLNVLNGDCSIIKHPSGRVTVIDVNNARKSDTPSFDDLVELLLWNQNEGKLWESRDFGQKRYPVNPISYMRRHGIESAFRFILTHPDMDHMGGIQDFFETLAPDNFWDTDNIEEKKFDEGTPYKKRDWLFYKSLRAGEYSNAKRLVLYAGSQSLYYNSDEDGSGGDGLHILAPTRALVSKANERGDCNALSYVILYRPSGGGRILFSGDSHDETWEYILGNHRKEIEGVDLLIAPHHGRASGRQYEFLDYVKPRLTFFGNARSEHLAYDAWRRRGLVYVTNNQANCMVVDANTSPMHLYVTNKQFAIQMNPSSYYDEGLRAWYVTPF